MPFPAASRRYAIVCIVLATAACSERPADTHSAVTDDFGDTVATTTAPVRIVSLNPSTTEVLFALGEGPHVVGRTAYDHFPAEVSRVADLGAGLKPNVEAVLATHPDFVLLYASADNRDAARRLRASGVATAAYRMDKIADLMRVTTALGALTHQEAAARKMIDTVEASLSRVRSATASLPHVKVFWPFWDSPLLSVGRGSFVNELIDIAGGRNVFDDLAEPSPVVTFEELLKRDPDVVIAGATSKARYSSAARWQSLRAVKEGHVLVVDSTIITGPSPRIGAGAASLAHALHPTLRF